MPGRLGWPLAGMLRLIPSCLGVSVGEVICKHLVLTSSVCHVPPVLEPPVSPLKTHHFTPQYTVPASDLPPFPSPPSLTIPISCTTSLPSRAGQPLTLSEGDLLRTSCDNAGMLAGPIRFIDCLRLSQHTGD